MDTRIVWFVKCINNVFQIGTEIFTMNLFEEELCKNESILKNQLIQFLESPNNEENNFKNIMYVYTSVVEKVIYEEIEVEEELSEFEVQSMKEFGVKQVKKKHDKKKKKKHAQIVDTTITGDSVSDSDKDSDGKSKDGYSSPDTAIQMADGNGTGKHSQKHYKKVKVLQEKPITIPEIHIYFGSAPIGLKSNVHYLYFIKNTASPIPVYDIQEEANYYMPSKFLIGNRCGCLIKSMIKEIENIWVPAVDILFIDPFSYDCATTRTDQCSFITLISNCVLSTFVRISQEMKSQNNYEMFVKDRSADFKKRPISVNIEKIIAFNELFLLQPPTYNKKKFEPLKHHFLLELRSLLQKTKRSLCYLLKKQSTSVINHFDALIRDNIEEISITIEKTPAMVLQCVNVLEVWNNKMKNLLSNIIEIRERVTIYDEFEFWKSCDEEVRWILDELESNDTKLFLKVIEKSSNNVETLKKTWENFKVGKLQFMHSCSLAKDNFKYISLIVENCMDLSTADLTTIIKIIPIWFENLRSIWLLSPYFGKDVHMLRLLIQIANSLCEIVRQKLGDLKSIFKNKDICEISKMSLSASKMIDVWYKSYLECRKSIESSGFNRWEFDKCKLFNKTNYVKRITNDIYKIVEKISQFLIILGPELRSAIKDMISLDVMISRVNYLYKVFDGIDFDLFCEDNVENWNLFIKEFNIEVIKVEDECKLFIDDSFNNLRSCKEAFITLELLQKLSTSQVFKNQFESKYGALIQQYENELITVETWFLTQKQAPPVSRHHPPVSGSIFWARTLVDKIKEPISIINLSSKFNLHEKNKIQEIYSGIVNQIKFYEKSKVTTWINEAKLLTTLQMSSYILTYSSLLNSKDEVLKIEDFINWSAWLKYVGDKNHILLDKQMAFKTNFNEKMYILIKEAEMMELLGVSLPKDLQLVISHKNYLLSSVKKVNDMVVMYNGILTSMTFNIKT
ncbi:uncharacterized protein LOC126910232 [Daktulosphaira vitifoliae]|uniref:uncharacterized protein LOC126910232 n=1 Tax=Daktulosphaira vitifoliae TaxID=58002 RepID=UPI0021AB0173|nr:uncharacterized protein LOC126910232 [Daktulosphaira vitifoliae]